MKWEELRPEQMRCLNLLLHRETYWLCRMLLCHCLINERISVKRRKRIYDGEIDDGNVIKIYETAKYNFFKFNRLLNRFERKYQLEDMRSIPWQLSYFKIRKFMKQRTGWEQRSIKYRTGGVFNYNRGVYENWWVDD